jgi:hypothetical protein
MTLVQLKVKALEVPSSGFLYLMTAQIIVGVTPTIRRAL